jgi:hypothetical protein
MTNREDQKAERERTIFSQFVEASGTEVEAGSIVSERPPKPDISCSIGGEKHYFELGEVTDQNLAARVATALKEMRITAGFFSQDNPLIKVFSDKARKNYDTLDGPLELVVYYDKQYPPPEGGLKESTLRDLELIVRDMLNRGWSRVWLFDTWNKAILCVWQ